MLLFAGAHVIGINCHFDPFIVLEGMKKMKEALDKAGLKVHLASQPLAFHTPDASKQGFIDLPEFPFGTSSFSSLYRELMKWQVPFKDSTGRRGVERGPFLPHFSL